MRLISFEHAPTLEKAATDFCLGTTGVFVLGPVESGKSVLGVALSYIMGCCIPRCKDGIRRARILVVRSTEGELDRGIKKTIKNWFVPKMYGNFKGSMPSVLTIRQFDMELELELFAFDGDGEEVLKKLRSTEYTMAFVNEAQYMSLKLVKAIEQRTGRFPPADICPEYDRKRRIFGDMNMPSDPAHWALRMMGKSPLPADMSEEERLQYKKPDNWKFYQQPPAVFAEKNERGQITGFKVNPKAENLFYSTEDGILQLTQGADVDDVKRDLMNEVVPVKSGVPRYKEFSMDWHVSKTPLELFPDAPIICGHDPGLFGGWVFLQHINGQWRAFLEYRAHNETAYEQADAILPLLGERVPFWREAGFIGWGDPFGNRASAAGNAEEGARTVFDILRARGLHFNTPAMKDNPETRLNTGRAVLKGTVGNGQPKAIFDSLGVPMLISALNGGMTMKRIGGGKEGEVKMAVDKKSGYADIGEAWEYAMWGGGESRDIVIGDHVAQQQTAKVIQPRRRLFGRR
jgi:hypothetical protein